MLRPAAGAMVVALAAVACTGKPGPSPSPPAAAVAAVRALLAPAPELAWAEQELVRRCVQAAGFDYPVRRPALDGGAGVLVEALTVSSVEVAQREGYGSLIRRGNNGADEGLDRYRAGLDPDERRRFDTVLAGPEDAAQVEVVLPDGQVVGTSTQGCVAEARRALYGSLETYLQVRYLPQGIRARGLGAVERDRGVRAALRRYAECMAAAGYPDVSSPSVALEVAAQRWGVTATAPVEERAMAVVDVSCQQQAELQAALDNALLAAASDLLATQEQQLIGLLEELRTATSRARAILEGAADPPSAGQ